MTSELFPRCEKCDWARELTAGMCDRCFRQHVKEFVKSILDLNSPQTDGGCPSCGRIKNLEAELDKDKIYAANQRLATERNILARENKNLKTEVERLRDDHELIEWLACQKDYDGQHRVELVRDTYWNSGVSNVRDAIRVARGDQDEQGDKK